MGEGRKCLVALRPEDVLAFVFWSRNCRSFLCLPAAAQACIFQMPLGYGSARVPVRRAKGLGAMTSDGSLRRGRERHAEIV